MSAQARARSRVAFATLGVAALIAFAASPWGASAAESTDLLIAGGTVVADDFLIDAGTVHLVTGDLLIQANVIRITGELDVLDGDLALVATEEIWIEGIVRVARSSAMVAPSVATAGALLTVVGAPGADGGDVLFSAPFVKMAPHSIVEAGAGGNGGDARYEGASVALDRVAAVAGAGGHGGDVVVRARTLDVQGLLVPGEGGRGGDATVLAPPGSLGHLDGADAFARGGAGGEGGVVRLDASGSEAVLPVGVGGSGGDGLARGGEGLSPAASGVDNHAPACDGADGVNALPSVDIQADGDGRAARADRNNGEAGFNAVANCEGGDGGRGGDGGSANAEGGDGADNFCNGGRGGNADASAGHGANGGFPNAGAKGAPGTPANLEQLNLNGGNGAQGQDGGAGGAGGWGGGQARAIGGHGGDGNCSGGDGGDAVANGGNGGSGRDGARGGMGGDRGCAFRVLGVPLGNDGGVGGPGAGGAGGARGERTDDVVAEGGVGGASLGPDGDHGSAARNFGQPGEAGDPALAGPNNPHRC